MRKVDVTVLVPSGATTGASVDVSDFTGMWFELDGVTAATCTVVLEGSRCRKTSSLSAPIERSQAVVP
jgi:hypothetical protein